MASIQEIFEGEGSEQRKKELNNERQTQYRKKQKIKYRALGINLMDGQHISIKRHELERMNQICVHCGAKFWMEEKNIHSRQTSPSFAVFCAGGKVSLPPL